VTALLLAVAEGDIAAGPIGLVIVFLLGVALVLLFRSMSKRIRRLPPSFPDQDERDPEDPTGR
jgi:Na+-transporting methylmalonyl-CoA/oxaloacetate decarboxylase gamma subunit